MPRTTNERNEEPVRQYYCQISNVPIDLHFSYVNTIKVKYLHTVFECMHLLYVADFCERCRTAVLYNGTQRAWDISSYTLQSILIVFWGSCPLGPKQPLWLRDGGWQPHLVLAAPLSFSGQHRRASASSNATNTSPQLLWVDDSPASRSQRAAGESQHLERTSACRKQEKVRHIEAITS